MPDDEVRRAGAAPRLTVVVPAYRCAPMLRLCLEGLCASSLPRAAWELVVVDDGSGDDTAAVAAGTADLVLQVPNGPRGPAHARNLGAMHARGEIVLFVDADVRVAPDTLRGFVALFDGDPALTAAFGAYDDTPAAAGLVSQYRNLLHHYIHQRHAGDAETFWAGCGGVRRTAFLEVGGFDAVRYPRPQVEDIDLGYRLRDAGGRIRLVPALAGTHLKHWSLATMLDADLHARAVPWMRLLLERRTSLAHAPLNLAPWEKVCTAAALLGACALLVGVMTGGTAWLAMAALCTGVIVVGNVPLFRFFAGRRGAGFAFQTVPLRILFYLVSALGAVWAVLSSAGLPPRSVPLPPLRPSVPM